MKKNVLNFLSTKLRELSIFSPFVIEKINKTKTLPILRVRKREKNDFRQTTSGVWFLKREKMMATRGGERREREEENDEVLKVFWRKKNVTMFCKI